MANDIFAGTSALDALYVGSTEIAKVYQGSNLVWEPDTPPPVLLPGSDYTNFGNIVSPGGFQYTFGNKTAPTTEPMPVTAGKISSNAAGAEPHYPCVTGDWQSQLSTGTWQYWAGSWVNFSGGAWIYDAVDDVTYHQNTAIGLAIAQSIVNNLRIGYRRIA